MPDVQRDREGVQVTRADDKKKRKPAPTPSPESTEPDYTRKCEVCGATPPACVPPLHPPSPTAESRPEMPTKKSATKSKIDNRKIVRTYSAGVFFAEVESRKGQEAVLRNARRIWYWAGAASLSTLAMDGTSKPGECKFPVAVDRIEVTQVIEVIDTTEAARASIDKVPVWRQ